MCATDTLAGRTSPFVTRATLKINLHLNRCERELEPSLTHRHHVQIEMISNPSHDSACSFGNLIFIFYFLWGWMEHFLSLMRWSDYVAREFLITPPRHPIILFQVSSIHSFKLIHVGSSVFMSQGEEGEDVSQWLRRRRWGAFVKTSHLFFVCRRRNGITIRSSTSALARRKLTVLDLPNIVWKDINNKVSSFSLLLLLYIRIFIS